MLGVMVAVALPASRPKEKYFEDGKSRKEGPIYVLKLQPKVIWMLHTKLEKALPGTLISCVHEGHDSPFTITDPLPLLPESLLLKSLSYFDVPCYFVLHGP